MSYTPIAIDRETLSIMGVPFPDLETLENIADAIGSNMFEGYQPTPKGIEIIRDYTIGKITFDEFIRAAKDAQYLEREIRYFAEVQKGIDDVAAGRVISHEEVAARLKAKGFNADS